MAVWMGTSFGQPPAENRGGPAVRTEGFYRALVDQALDIITVVTDQGAIAFESKAIQRVLGYEVDELLGSNVFEHIHPDDLDIVRDAFNQALETGESSAVEFRFRHKDGSWRMFEG